MKKKFTFSIRIIPLFILISFLSSISKGQNITFSNATSPAGIAYFGSTWSNVWADVNKDNYYDFFSTNHGFPSLYMNNKNGTFQQIPLNFYVDTLEDGTLVKYDLHGAGFADFNNDGFQDLYINTGQDFNEDGEETKNVLFENIEGNLNLTNQVKTYQLENGKNRGRNLLWFDFDKNGYLDLMTFNQEKDDFTGKSSLFLQRTPGNFTILDDSLRLIDPYIHYSGVIFNEKEHRNQLIAINRATYNLHLYNIEEVPFKKNDEEGIREIGDISINDFNGDGRLDYFVTTSSENSEIFQVNDTLIHGNLKPKSGKLTFTFKTDGDFILVFDWYPIPSNPVLRMGKSGVLVSGNLINCSKDSSWQYGIKSHSPLTDFGIFMGYDSIRERWEINVMHQVYAFFPFKIIATTPITDIQRIGFDDSDTKKMHNIYDQNTNGKYTRRTFLLGNGQVKGSTFSTVSADFDNDMDIDIVMNTATSSYNYENVYLQNKGNGTFEQFTSGIFIGESHEGNAGVVNYCDYDNDGFLDVLFENGEGLGFLNQGPTQLFKNNGNDNHWIQIDLVGTKSNRDGIGTKINCYTNNKRQMRFRGTEFHNGGHSAGRIHFGLADNEIIDSLILQWPSGIEQKVYNIGVDQIITIQEDSSRIITHNPVSVDKNLFRLYPNPAQDYIYLNYSGKDNLNNYSAVLYDVNGKKYFDDTIKLDNNKWWIFPIEHLPRGHYFLNINSSFTFTFIKI